MADDPAAIARAEVRLLSLPTRRTLSTAHDGSPPPDRQLVVVGLETIDGVIGWGECSALNAPTYTSEWAADSFERLAAWAQGGARPDTLDVPMTFAATEMAYADLALRAGGRSLATALGATASVVRAGATIGLAPLHESVSTAKDLVAAGYRKLKVKVDPSQLDDVAHALSHVFEHRGDDPIDIHVDGNGSLGANDLMGLLGLSRHGVNTIEQPFPVGRPDLAAELLLAAEASVIADESVATLGDARRLLDAKALTGIAIKPPRVGGMAAAHQLLAWCRSNGVDASLGGMLECGLGRHALAAFGALDGFTITGDLSPAAQWLEADPWPDIEMLGADLLVPTTAGVAPLPDQKVLDQLTIRRVEQQHPRLS